MVNRTTSISEAPLVERTRKLSDQEFEEAITTLEEGRIPFASPEMLRRLADTIVSKLWEGQADPVETG
jgi:hypothetical protein